MTDRPEDFRFAPEYGRVLTVHPQSWEIDVLCENGGVIWRATVLGHRLPEVSTADRPQYVMIFHADAVVGRAFALPIDGRLVGLRYDRGELVWLSEVQGFRITIRAPGNTGAVVPDQTGELEIRSEKGSRTLQLRIQEEGGVIRLDTPHTRAVLRDDAEEIELHSDGDVKVDAGQNIDATAGADITAKAGGNATVEAAGNGTIQVGGALSMKSATFQIETGAMTVKAASVDFIVPG